MYISVCECVCKRIYGIPLTTESYRSTKLEPLIGRRQYDGIISINVDSPNQIPYFSVN